jgi:hypothetical protein
MKDDLKLSNWLSNNFKRIEIFEQFKSTCEVNKNTFNTQITPKSDLNRNLSIGLLSTNNIEEFRDLAFTYAPVGTIKTDIDPEFYQSKLLLLRSELTKSLLNQRNSRLAEIYIKILERRDKSHWNADVSKKMEISSDKSDNINITFTVV